MKKLTGQNPSLSVIQRTIENQKKVTKKTNNEPVMVEVPVNGNVSDDVLHSTSTRNMPKTKIAVKQPRESKSVLLTMRVKPSVMAIFDEMRKKAGYSQADYFELLVKWGQDTLEI